MDSQVVAKFKVSQLKAMEKIMKNPVYRKSTEEIVSKIEVQNVLTNTNDKVKSKMQMLNKLNRQYLII